MLVLPGGAAINQSKYDEAEFLVGRAPKGEQPEREQFKIHAGYAAEIDKWVRSKKFPYETPSDLMRHAVVRHLRYFLPSMEGEVDGSLLHELAQIDEIVVRWKFQNDFVAHLDRIAEQVNLTLQMPGGKREVERMLRDIKRRIDRTRSSFHKGVYQKMFNDRFGGYVNHLTLIEFEPDGDDGEPPAAAEEDDAES